MLGHRRVYFIKINLPGTLFVMGGRGNNIYFFINIIPPLYKLLREGRNALFLLRKSHTGLVSLWSQPADNYATVVPTVGFFLLP